MTHEGELGSFDVFLTKYHLSERTLQVVAAMDNQTAKTHTFPCAG
ncbi:hypothetical protein [Pseudomonas helmanticensis]|nr:hypothetical protein [Pseudomonas helmanticensis]